jgi:hypothetical protein
MKKYQKISNSQDERNSSQKSKPQKPDYPVVDTEVSGFSRTDIVQVEFEI